MNELEKATAIFLNDLGYKIPSIKVAADNEFKVNLDTQEIEIALEYNEIQGNMLKRFIKRKFNYDIKNIFLFALFHELGHLITLDKFSELDLAFDEVMKLDIELKVTLLENSQLDPESLYNTYEDINFKYWELPLEDAANAWAVEAMKQMSARNYRCYNKLKKTIFRAANFDNLKEIVYLLGVFE